MRILVDCDVLLDVATGRTPFVTDSRKVLDWCESNPGKGFIAWHTVANVYYLCRKDSDSQTAKQFLHDLVVIVDVVETGTAQVKHALVLSMKDFEDAMQSAAAVCAGVDYIVTRNIKHYRTAPIPAITPTDFLALHPP